jgi:hypothetical protein
MAYDETYGQNPTFLLTRTTETMPSQRPGVGGSKSALALLIKECSNTSKCDHQGRSVPYNVEAYTHSHVNQSAWLAWAPT